MKRFYLAIMLSAGALTMNAQTTVQGSKFTDNWSVGINAGGVTTIHTGYAFWKHMRPVFGIQIGKQFTPALGMTLEGNASVNTSPSKTAFDASNISLLGRVNLMNLFAGYKGQPRLFEMEAVGGLGWLHYYNSGPSAWPGYDSDAWSAKFGLNFNFNVGEKKAWTIQVKPAVIYNISGIGYESNRGASHPGQLSRNSASVELAAGIIYHFKNSNGTHSFVTVRPYDQAEVDELNSRINSLRSEVGQKEGELNNLRNENRQLQRDLNDCRNKKVQTTTTAASTEAVVAFNQGKSKVMSTQMAGIERIATYMKNNPLDRVFITGYASPEGSASFNQKLSEKRAKAVKDILVKKYNIDSSRIVTEGKGVGSIFSSPSWNRVSICTVNAK